ncbi:CaiB/BaiF CoA-transferase family protein [Cupriavidus sp. AcVe19-1a]|uniref:CaiB/BaiF CoA transferase family protein n=1 Tax=Cupriavidus sp. AcVe19-1a TaxID=2821359 RepID=UPI001AE8DB38|nr:CaiB/BaiF CoA-transferase family protein [Cupriavidus sp. AcVe19-1a]MBP0630518.1 CoA transferase [Cupriavidus sp. AcVe19-1a]
MRKREGLRPLDGVKVVEFEGIGPAPLCGAMLAGLGAEVTLVARPVAPDVRRILLSQDIPSEMELEHGKSIVQIDLKSPEGVSTALDLVAGADALIEGLRPGTMERLGLGPKDCHARNPRLIYGRMTGWGQTGPLAQSAGHDLNYIALTGLLQMAGRDGTLPMVPPTVIGDGAGALGLAFGITSGILHARATGQGSVVDAAITDIVAMLGSLVQVTVAAGCFGGPEPSPFHDSPFYDVYGCSDGRAITLGALEPKFYRELLERLELQDIDPAAQYDATQWPTIKARIAKLFASRPSTHWASLLEGTDVCFAKVLTLEEAALHPHNLARGTFRLYRQGDREVVHSSMAPRFMTADNG